MSEYLTKRKTIEDKIELMREALIKFINATDLDWAKRNELQSKLDEIVEE